MQNAPYVSRLRYLDAADVQDAETRFDGLNVIGTDGEKIGDVDGFIIDEAARRLYYIVVDSGGWFTSRRLLLPVGHVALAAGRKALQADVTRDALRRMPEFDERRFDTFSDEELRAFERNTVVACCPDEPLEDVSVPTWGYDSRRHYRQPDWWRDEGYAPERLRGVGSGGRTAATRVSTGTAAGAPEAFERESVVAREARGAGDPSPHLDGRAQPGDVLGIETGGERTGVGDTAEDENTRREDADRRTRDRG